ncbi:LysR family transcriptional regulator [Saccharopolyspora erythraea]|uniref:LysR family transcriptional regulator n=1 Tax=Saccharopolyspora erythraea TaxID=1836 RepID=A0ABN1EDV9_SACER|nr:LysR family transcriptional regulator [Saccharopolyspora erythraea]QRK92035.1 LysR family transcriptional regulator [Saccharopolyspora erythraea]
MELRELEWFVALAETEQVTRTAERLHVTQPTLSRAVNRLEKHFGTRLFDRVGKRLRLNRYGEVVRAHAARVLGEIDAAEQRVGAMLDPQRGVVSLGFVTSYGAWLVPQLVQEYRQQAPSAQFMLEGGPADAVLDMLRHESVDAAFCSPEPRDEDIHWHPIAEEPLRLVVNENHPLATAKRIELADASGETFVALRPEFGLRQITDVLCNKAGFTPAVALEATEIPTLWGLVGAGAGVAVLPAATRGPLTRGTKQLSIKDAGAVRTAGFATLATRKVSPPVARFVEFVHSHPVIRR